MKKILIVEDTEEHVHVIESVLSSYSTVVVKSLKEAKASLTEESFDLVILDLNLGDGSGLEIISNKEALKCDNFIICSDSDEISNKIAGFSMGVADYVCKPFNPIELKLRVDRILSNIKTRQEIRAEEFAGIKVNSLTQEVFVLNGNNWESVSLTNIEFKIILFFMNNKNYVVSREKLLDKVWGEGHFVSDRVVDSQISKMRKKLQSRGAQIVSIYGVGYCLRESEKAA